MNTSIRTRLEQAAEACKTGWLPDGDAIGQNEPTVMFGERLLNGDADADAAKRYITSTFRGDPCVMDTSGSINIAVAICGVQGNAEQIAAALNAEPEIDRYRAALRAIAREANEGGVFHPGICADSEHRNAYVTQMAWAALNGDQVTIPAEHDDSSSEVCECCLSCADDPATACGMSGTWHVHPGEPCPVHPDAPGDR